MGCCQLQRLLRPSGEGSAPGPVLPTFFTLRSHAGTRSARGWSTVQSSSWSPGGQTCWWHMLVPRPMVEETDGPKTEPRAWVTAAAHLPMRLIACCQLGSVPLGSLFLCTCRWVSCTVLGQVSPWVQDTGRCYRLLAQGKRDMSCSQSAICSPPRAWVCHLLEERADGKVVRAVTPAAAVCCVQQHAPPCLASSSLHSQGHVPFEAWSREELMNCSVPERGAGRLLTQQTEAHEYPLSSLCCASRTHGAGTSRGCGTAGRSALALHGWQGMAGDLHGHLWPFKASANTNHYLPQLLGSFPSLPAWRLLDAALMLFLSALGDPGPSLA